MEDAAFPEFKISAQKFEFLSLPINAVRYFHCNNHLTSLAFEKMSSLTAVVWL
jgi:hypothetical protein